MSESLREPIDVAIEALAFHWSLEVIAAQQGNLAPLIVSLRSSKVIAPRDERGLRNFLAALLSGELKRSRGRPRDWDIATPQLMQRKRNSNLFDAVEYVRATKDEAREAGRIKGVEREAVAEAGKLFGIDEQTIHNRLHRSKRARRTARDRRA
jgi:hypothetical protein